MPEVCGPSTFRNRQRIRLDEGDQFATRCSSQPTQKMHERAQRVEWSWRDANRTRNSFFAKL
jgi:hypothetical protein